jgi:hypothetical protein
MGLQEARERRPPQGIPGRDRVSVELRIGLIDVGAELLEHAHRGRHRGLDLRVDALGVCEPRRVRDPHAGDAVLEAGLKVGRRRGPGVDIA